MHHTAEYALTAFCVLHIFMLNNGWFRELKDWSFSFDRMVSFTADRPFAYRVLMPALVNAGACVFPKDFIREHRQWLIEGSPLVRYSKNTLFRYESIALKVHLAIFLPLPVAHFFTLCCQVHNKTHIRLPGGFC